MKLFNEGILIPQYFAEIQLAVSISMSTGRNTAIHNRTPNEVDHPARPIDRISRLNPSDGDVGYGLKFVESPNRKLDTGTWWVLLGIVTHQY